MPDQYDPNEASLVNSLADMGADMSGYTDAPPDVVATAPTGEQMDLSFLSQEWDDNWDDVRKELYYRTHVLGIAPTPQSAAQDAKSMMQAQQQAANDMRMMQADPKAAAAVEEQRNASMTAAKSAYESADNILGIMDRLRGYKKGAEGTENKTPKYFGRVGPVDSAFPARMNDDRNAWFIDFQALKDQLALAARGAIKGTGPISDFEQKMLANAAMGGLDYGRDDASFSQVFEQTYDIAQRKRDEQKAALDAMQKGSAQPQPSATPQAAPAAAAQQTKKIGNQTWVKTADGWIRQR
jgi:hypothetical protein